MDIHGNIVKDASEIPPETPDDTPVEEKTKSSKDPKEVLRDFKKIVLDFLNDILKTYPELRETLNEDLKAILGNENDEESVKRVYEYCEALYPKRFFDILYQNEEMFGDEEIRTDFLPGIEFKYLWKQDISDKTRHTLWKYLQLILFTVVSSLSHEESFGDTAKLFEAINQDEFKEKLEETMKNMKDMFNEDKKDGNDKSSQNMPDPEELHEHVNGMLNGKLGKLAKDIAEETAKDFNIDMADGGSVDSVFKNLFNQPTKLMSLVKNVGSKLDERMKSGDIKESELLQEASEMMEKMKSMPGMGNLQQMFGKMGMGGMGAAGGKMDMNAMRNNISKNMKVAKQRERMKEKLDQRRAAAAASSSSFSSSSYSSSSSSHPLRPSETTRTQTPTAQTPTGEVERTVFRTGEKYEKTLKPPSGGNKKKRRKKK